MDNRDQGKEGVMNDGKTKSAAGLYTRVDLDEVLYTDNFQYAKTALAAANAAEFAPPKQLR